MYKEDDYIDKDVVLKLSEIRRRNYKLIVRNQWAREDFIQLSYDYHFGGSGLAQGMI